MRPTPPERGARSRPGEDGFTLIEVVVALAVLAAVLGSIASLTAANRRTVLVLEDRLALVSVARSVEAALDRDELTRGPVTGTLGGYAYAVLPRPAAGLEGGAPLARADAWRPRPVLLRVQAPSGRVLEIETLRLVRDGAP